MLWERDLPYIAKVAFILLSVRGFKFLFPLYMPFLQRRNHYIEYKLLKANDDSNDHIRLTKNAKKMYVTQTSRLKILINRDFIAALKLLGIRLWSPASTLTAIDTKWSATPCEGRSSHSLDVFLLVQRLKPIIYRLTCFWRLLLSSSIGRILIWNKRIPDLLKRMALSEANSKS